MKLTYLGHAAFELALGDGRRIVFDPYEAGSYDGALAYGAIEGAYDIAVVSHDHADHRSEAVVGAATTVVDAAGEREIDGVRVVSWATWHDETEGSERGSNLVSVVEAEGLRIAHLGDLGHMIDPAEMPGLAGVDVLLVPVGGYFTIDAKAASEIARAIGPRIVVPMHFKTPKVDFPIAPAEPFVELAGGATRPGGSELELDPGALPEETETILLEPAL